MALFIPTLQFSNFDWPFYLFVFHCQHFFYPLPKNTKRNKAKYTSLTKILDVQFRFELYPTAVHKLPSVS